jgi:hypothetical protein
VVTGGVSDKSSSVTFEQIERWANGFNPDFLYALAMCESSLNPNAISPVGAKGLFQFMPITVRDLKERWDYTFDPLNPEQATKAAALYLTWLFDTLHDLEKVLAAWNWGIGNIRKGGVLPQETRTFIARFYREYANINICRAMRDGRCLMFAEAAQGTLKVFFETALKLLRIIFGNTTWWSKIEDAFIIFIMLAELDHESGPEKKKEVIEKMYAYLEELGITLRPKWLWDVILGFAIDLFINIINEKYGHDWASVLNEKLGGAK